MIRIRIDPEKREIEMTGHAGAGGPGFDQVCCAASTLIKAYLYSLEKLEDGIGHRQDIDATVEDGHIRITIDHTGGYYLCTFRAYADGLEMLTKEYPEHCEKVD